MRGHLRGNHGRNNFCGNFYGDFYNNLYNHFDKKDRQFARRGSVMPPLAPAVNRDSDADKRFAATNRLENTIVKIKLN
jgi:hypothetical protein